MSLEPRYYPCGDNQTCVAHVGEWDLICETYEYHDSDWKAVGPEHAWMMRQYKFRPVQTVPGMSAEDYDTAVAIISLMEPA